MFFPFNFRMTKKTNQTYENKDYNQMIFVLKRINDL